MQGCSNTNKELGCYGTLKSRRILPEAGWNCMQFWYYLGTAGFNSFQVSLIINETKAILWNSDSHQGKAGHWMYVRLSLDSGSSPYQVSEYKRLQYETTESYWNMNSLVASFNIYEPQVGLILPNLVLTGETEDVLPDFNSL